MKGKVFSAYGKNYTVVLNDNEEVINCTLRGRFKLLDSRLSNPIVVGDNVIVKKINAEDYIIEKLEKRKNYIARKSTKLSKESQLLASNIDQVIIISSILNPKFVYGFVDRVIALCEAFGVSVKLVINKTDLLKEKNKDLIEIENIYKKLGYFLCSTSIEKNYLELKPFFEKKTSVVIGQSGVGKSTLINYFLPNIDLRTNIVSSYNQKGKHTTSYAKMYKINNNSFIIDTPGVRKFGFFNLKKEEFKLYFTEIFEASKFCKYNNCNHINEPKCNVIKMVEKNMISLKRYNNYLSMFYDG